MAAATRLASEGFRVAPRHRQALNTLLHRRPNDDGFRRMFLKRSERKYRVGDTFRQPKLAQTLERLAQAGCEDFYRGHLARQIVDDMAIHSGLLTAADLARYICPVEIEPLCGSYRGHWIATTPPPGGGLQLLQALSVLAQFEPPGDQGDLHQWRGLIALTTAEILRQRELWPDYPTYVSPSFIQWMLGVERANEIAALVRGGDYSGPVVDGEEPGDTTHLCVADSAGCVVSLTQSIQSVFGAKVVNEALGFVYNNYLCTCPRSGPGYVLSSKCVPKSNVAPTIVFHADRNAGFAAHALRRHARPMLAIGAAGSRRILSSVLQVVSHVVDRGIGIAQAVAEPRVHGLATGSAWIEEPAVSAQLKQMLAAQFPRVRTRAAHSRHMGSVQAIEFRPDGTSEAAADPRRQGSATTLPPMLRSSETSGGVPEAKTP
jgi:gamma-glutamyltranspeptidase/glutathione hydrolase